MPVTIQAYYLGDNRASEQNEVNAIRKIMEILKAKPETRCDFLPLVTYTKFQQESFIGPEVTQAYNNILKDGPFGSQYDWLGRFAKNHMNIEVSIHGAGNAVHMLKTCGRLMEIHDDVTGKTFIVDPAATDAYVHTLFKDCSFPLADRSKMDMREEYIRLGYEDVMELTWFCYHPTNNSPCGLCPPATKL